MVIVTIVFIVLLTFFCCKRRRRRRLKTTVVHCSNPLSDQNDYFMPPKEANTQFATKDGDKVWMTGTAVPVLPCLENRPGPRSVTDNTGEPVFDTKPDMTAPRAVTMPQTHHKPSISAPKSATQPRFNRSLSVSVPRPAAKLQSEQKQGSGAAEQQSKRKLSCSNPGSVTRPRSYRKPSVSVPKSGAKPARGPKPKVSIPSSITKPQCKQHPIESAQFAQKVSTENPTSNRPRLYTKPSVSAPKCSTESPCNQKPSVSTPTSGAGPKCDDVVKYENIGACFLPKPGVDDEPEVKENVAYRCIGIATSEYAVPQQLREQQRERNALRPSEIQAVEAYAISTL